MSLVLNYTLQQANDAKRIFLIDTTGDYDAATNPNGWGDPNPRFGFVLSNDIVSGSVTTPSTPPKYHLLLDVKVTDKYNRPRTYQTVNLFDLHGGIFSGTDELFWVLYPSDLVTLVDDPYGGNEAMGTSEDVFIDGVYEVTYSLVQNDAHTNVISSLTQHVFVDGDVRLSVYKALREIPTEYDNENNDRSKEVLDALLAYSFLKSINAASDVADAEQLCTQLFTLDKFMSDGNKYTW